MVRMLLNKSMKHTAQAAKTIAAIDPYPKPNEPENGSINKTNAAIGAPNSK